MVDLNVLNTQQYQQALQSSQSQTQSFNQAVSSLSANVGPLGRAFGLITVPVALATKGLGGYASAAQAAQDRNLGLATTSAVTGQSLSKLEGQASKLARTLPVGSAAATQTIAQVQSLGIVGDGSEVKIGKLANTFTRLAAATQSSTPAVTQGLANVSRAFGDTNLDPARVGKFADVVTTLTSTVGGSADGILGFSKQIAPYARQAGIGESATLGISAAFSKLGDDGSSAGTAINRVLGDINKSVRDGGSQVSIYAGLLGKTNDQFLSLAKNDPSGTLSKVVTALGSGAQGQRALESLGLDGVRTQQALTALSQGGGLQSAIDTANGAVGNGSTQKASDVAFSGLTNQLTKLQTAAEQVAEAFGTPILSVLQKFTTALSIPVRGLATVVNSGAANDVGKLVTPLVEGFAVLKGLRLVGLTAASGKVAGQSGVVRSLEAGRLIGNAGSLEDAQAEAESRAALGGRAGRRGRRDVLSLNVAGKLLAPEQLDADGNPIANRPLGAFTAPSRAALAFSTSRTQSRRLQTDADEAYAYNDDLDRGGQGVADANAARRAELARTRVPRALRFAAATGVQLKSASSFLNNSVYRAAGTADPTERVGVDNATGIFKGSAASFKAAVGSVDGFTAKVRAAANEIGVTAKTINTERSSNRQLAQTYIRASASPTVLGATSALKATGTGLRAAGSSALDLVGGPAQAALLAGTAITGYLLNKSSAAKAENISNSQDFASSSITSGLDAYDDALGKATSNTVTFSDSLAQAAKTLATNATSISGTTKVTAADVSAAAALKTPTSFSYKGTTDQIIAQVNAQSASGLTPSQLQEVKYDLIRELKPQQAGAVLAGIKGNATDDTTTSNQLGAGGVISASAARALVQGGAGTSLGLGGKAIQNLGFDNSVEQTSQQKQAQKETFGLIQQEFQKQSSTQGQNFATQQELKSFQVIGKELVATNANKNQIAGAAQAVDQALGGKGQILAPSAFQLALDGGNLATYAASKDKTAAITLKNDASVGVTANGTLTAGNILDPDIGVRAQGLGALSNSFDNRRADFAGGAVNAALNQPGDITKQSAGVDALVSSALKAGQSFTSLSDATTTLVGRIDGDGTALDSFTKAVLARTQELEQARSLTQSAGTSFQEQATLNLGQLNTVGDTSTAQATRTQGGQAAIDQGASVVSQLQARIAATKQYQEATARSAQDFGIQQSQQDEDFGVQRVRAEQSFDLQLSRSREDLHISLLRSERDFNIQIGRAAQDSANSAYAPFKRIQVQALTDGQTLLLNISQQADALAKQNANLASLRKEGLSNTTIQNLGLADATNAQEDQALVGNLSGNRTLVSGLNAQSARKEAAGQTLGTDAGNLSVSRGQADLARSASDAEADAARSIARSKQDQAIAFAQQDADFAKQQGRQEQQFQLGVDRQLQDYQQAQTSVSGTFAQLQSLANKGLLASQKDFSKVFHNGLNDILKDPAFATIAQVFTTFQQSGVVTSGPSSTTNTAIPIPGSASSISGKLNRYADGGITLGPHYGLVGEKGVPEAMVPLDTRGVTMLAQAMERYLGTTGLQGGRGGVTYVTHTSTHTTDASTKILGEVTVKATSPNELGIALRAKKRSTALTASAVKA